VTVLPSRHWFPPKEPEKPRVVPPSGASPCAHPQEACASIWSKQRSRKSPDRGPSERWIGDQSTNRTATRQRRKLQSLGRSRLVSRLCGPYPFSSLLLGALALRECGNWLASLSRPNNYTTSTSPYRDLDATQRRNYCRYSKGAFFACPICALTSVAAACVKPGNPGQRSIR
jgi:hypothetical protein